MDHVSSISRKQTLASPHFLSRKRIDGSVVVSIDMLYNLFVLYMFLEPATQRHLFPRAAPGSPLTLSVKRLLGPSLDHCTSTISLPSPPCLIRSNGPCLRRLHCERRPVQLPWSVERCMTGDPVMVHMFKLSRCLPTCWRQGLETGSNRIQHSLPY